MKKLDEDNLDSLRELTELYIMVKDVILFGEESEPEMKSDIQAINELRNGFDHLMRVFASCFEVERDYNPKYIKKHRKSIWACI